MNKSGWRTRTKINWLENASFGLRSCLPLMQQEKLLGVAVSNADVYLEWLRFMAPRIDAYIDTHKINGPGAREHRYVLQRFIRHCQRFADWTLMEPGAGGVESVRIAYKRAVGVLGLA